jgi:hypothetical protein
MPVVRALDEIERLPGFTPEHVEWRTTRRPRAWPSIRCLA